MKAGNAEPGKMDNSCHKEVFMNERSNKFESKSQIFVTYLSTELDETVLNRLIGEHKKVDIIKDADGKSIVVINDLRFKGRRSVDWNVVEDCLKEYIGKCAEITETSDVVYIGADFPDEFTHSKDTKELRGGKYVCKSKFFKHYQGDD